MEVLRNFFSILIANEFCRKSQCESRGVKVLHLAEQ